MTISLTHTLQNTLLMHRTVCSKLSSHHSCLRSVPRLPLSCPNNVLHILCTLANRFHHHSAKSSYAPNFHRTVPACVLSCDSSLPCPNYRYHDIPTGFTILLFTVLRVATGFTMNIGDRALHKITVCRRSGRVTQSEFYPAYNSSMLIDSEVCTVIFFDFWSRLRFSFTLWCQLCVSFNTWWTLGSGFAFTHDHTFFSVFFKVPINPKKIFWAFAVPARFGNYVLTSRVKTAFWHPWSNCRDVHVRAMARIMLSFDTAECVLVFLILDWNPLHRTSFAHSTKRALPCGFSEWNVMFRMLQHHVTTFAL